MEFQHITYQKDGPIARITLNRPEKLNAQTTRMKKELVAAVDDAGEDDAVKVVVIKGAGRAFCAGQDMSEIGHWYGWETPKPGEKGRRPSQRARLKVDRRDMAEPYRSLFLSWKPLIAQVHGYCLEAGCIIQLMCDITIASEDAVFGFPAQRMAFAGLTFLQPLIQLMGYKVTREILLTGRKFDAREAERIGFINRCVPAEQLEAEVERTAQAIAQVPADAIVIGKAYTNMVYESMGLTSAFYQFPLGHTLATNLQFAEGEYNFFKARRDKGVKGAFQERDKPFVELVGG